MFHVIFQVESSKDIGRDLEAAGEILKRNRNRKYWSFW